MNFKELFAGRLLTKHEVEKVYKQYDEEVDLSIFEEVEAFNNGACTRCNNSEEEMLQALPNQAYYCLNCLQLGRVASYERLYYMNTAEADSLAEKKENLLTWDGTLSNEQARASKDLINSLEDKRPHCILAVTGAGKTEMIFPVISKVLEEGGRVCVASPRIDVCLELAPRLGEAFSKTEISLLYGGTTEVYSYKQLVVSTTHQLLRFKEAFDLLIVDEVDAFPLAGDASLHFAVQRATKPSGKLVYLTATPDSMIEEGVKNKTMTSTVLPARYHGHPLPEPVFMWLGNWRSQIQENDYKSKLFTSLKEFTDLDGVKLIFMPDIRLAEILFKHLEKFLPNVRLACVHSKDPLRKEKVQALRDGELDGLITTTILERGVTFTNCHVFIVGAEDRLYSVSALVQMSGRVGRRPNYPTGTLIYGHYGKSRSMLKARSQIQGMNKDALERGLVSYE